MSTTPRVVVAFPAIGRLRSVPARLRGDVQREVKQIIDLAPALGAQNPKVCSSVVQYMRHLLPNPPPLDGLEQEHTVSRERTAAANRRPVPRRPLTSRPATAPAVAQSDAALAYALALGERPGDWLGPRVGPARCA